ncbi:MAG: FG-GAP-like repeat-containing protein, partial [Chloroflexi bacterium]|nr:FG-GAP-like repeat-containing protein [Chloroflexota bacterium]
AYDAGLADEGAAWVFLGSVSGIVGSNPGTASAQLESNQAAAFFGGTVAGAGDVNGDGYADVIVGEPNADSFLGGSKVTGQAHVHLGSASGLSLSAAWSVEGDTEGALLGSSVGTAGDVNADGYSDVVVGATHFGPGEAYLYLGSSTGLATTPAWTVSANQSSYLGFSVGTAGDVNGDGYSDVLVGAYAHDNGATDEGAAFLYLGSASGPSTTAAWTAEGNQASAYFGTVSTAGDLNGDGYGDVVVSAYQFDNGETNEGRTFAYLGSATGLATTASWTQESDLDFAFSGYAVSSAGDERAPISGQEAGEDHQAQDQEADGRAHGNQVRVEGVFHGSDFSTAASVSTRRS